VPPSVKPSRRYSSPLRAEQAQATRRRVLEAAHRLFVERGYGRTTITAVAAEAGVSPETIYLSVGGKRGLLEGVVDAAIAGSQGVPVQEQTVFTELRGLATARQRLQAHVAATCQLLARTSPVHAVIRGAADREPFAVALRQRLLARRLDDITSLLNVLVVDDLRPGLSAEQAAQRFCALASPELHHLLTVELHWSTDRHQEWLTDMLERELLDSP
jgi:AcrR family transcriptional regulator